MERQSVISQFTDLVKAVANDIGKYKIYTALKRDKNTIDRWLDGAYPQDDIDVARLVELALINHVAIQPFQSFSPIYDFSAEISYEDKLAAGPPNLSWIRKIHTELRSYRTDICGLKIDCPLGIGASPLTGDEHWSIAMLELGFGLSTFKTRRTGPKDPWCKPQMGFVLDAPSLLDSTNLPEVSVTMRRGDIQKRIPDLVNSLGVPSESVADWQASFMNIRHHPLGHLMGISVIGDADAKNGFLTDFVEAVSCAAQLEPTFVELNLFCPNLKGKDLSSDLNLLGELCREAKKRLRGNAILFAKLAYGSDDQLVEIAKIIGGVVDGIIFRNTIKVRPIQYDRDGDKHTPFPGRETAGLSGPSTFPMTLKGVQVLDRQRTISGSKFAIIAAGGVADVDNVEKLLESGAATVQAVTTPMFDPLLAWKVDITEAAPAKKPQNLSLRVCMQSIFLSEMLLRRSLKFAKRVQMYQTLCSKTSGISI
jgi:dihydroorotate dehydrogenase